MYLKENEVKVIPSGLKQTFENKFTLNIGEKEIIKMKANNVITDRDVEIANFIFKFKFATADQIYKYIKEDKEKINLKNRLEKLVKYRILNKFMLSDYELDKVANDAYQIYCLDLGGKYLLSHYSNEDTTDWYSIVNMKSSELISKNIFATEIYLRIKETCGEKLVNFKIDPEYRVAKKSIVPTFMFSMKMGTQSRYFIGECVRDYDFPVYFPEKAQKLECFLTTNAWKKYYYDAELEPVLFVFADSDEIALEASQVIDRTTEIKNFRLSTDERIQRVIYETGAFLKYEEEENVLKEIKATTFKP